jgi:hypothetical protein
MKRSVLLACACALFVSSAVAAPQPTLRLERVTTAVPFPRGVVLLDGKLYALSRGRVRSSGGVSADINDLAGALWEIDPSVSEDGMRSEVSDAVRNNGKVFAEPTSPPFRTWDRSSNPPEADTQTDRPYCVLRYHAPSRSFYICAFSGIDKKPQPGSPTFYKNNSDAILRFDLRTMRWSEIERHETTSEWTYPHHDPATNAPPHGWVKGPNNMLPVGDSLYAVAKDNNALVRYDLSTFENDPTPRYPPSEYVIGEEIEIAGLGKQHYLGQSGLASDGTWLYISYRTSSVVVRVKLDQNGRVVKPIVGELVAKFIPYDAATGMSSDVTDIALDPQGRLYVICAEPTRIHRFLPDPANVYDAGAGSAQQPWFDLAAAVGNPKVKGENVMIDPEGRVYITSTQGYPFQNGAEGTVYRLVESR